MKNNNIDNDSNNIGNIKCPICGSTKIIFSGLQILAGPPYHPICKDCNYTWVYSTKISSAQPENTQPEKLNLFQRLIEKIF